MFGVLRVMLLGVITPRGLDGFLFVDNLQGGKQQPSGRSVRARTLVKGNTIKAFGDGLALGLPPKRTLQSAQARGRVARNSGPRPALAPGGG